MGLECVAVGSQVKGLSFPYQATVLRCLIFTPPRLGLKLKVRTSAAIRLSRHARMMRPHVPTQQTKCSPLLPTRTTRVHRAAAFRRPAPTQLRVSPPTPLCSAEQQLATYATIKVSAYPQPCSTPHIKRATLSTSSISLTRSALPGRAMHTDANSQERGRKRGQPRGEGHRGRHR